jgi:tRNA pseudouridine38-40 synthase
LSEQQLDSQTDRYKAIVAYDGTDFLGFQRQKRERTVQGTIEVALSKIIKQSVRIVAAGRTDSGVHADGQVISFDVDWKHSLANLQTALNVNLPQDIAVVELTKSPADFHPRFDAVSRQYRYTILNQPTRDVFRRRYALQVPVVLDVSKMQQASHFLLGGHDFASFGRPPQGENTYRTVFQAEWYTAGDELYFEITANAFLYRMVRNIVGSLLDVGMGKLEIEDFLEILQAKSRSNAVVPASPNGLCLIKVNY